MISLREVVFFVGVMMFLIGACCVDSNFNVAAIMCICGVTVGFIADHFLY